MIPTVKDTVDEAVLSVLTQRFLSKTIFGSEGSAATSNLLEAILFSDEVTIQFSDDTLLEW
jgi:hypothetical protein